MVIDGTCGELRPRLGGGGRRGSRRLFVDDATYRSFIFDEPHVGRDGVRPIGAT